MALVESGGRGGIDDSGLILGPFSGGELTMFCVRAKHRCLMVRSLNSCATVSVLPPETHAPCTLESPNTLHSAALSSL